MIQWVINKQKGLALKGDSDNGNNEKKNQKKKNQKNQKNLLLIFCTP